MKYWAARVTYALSILALALAMLACSLGGGGTCDNDCALATEGARAWSAQQTAMYTPQP